MGGSTTGACTQKGESAVRVYTFSRYMVEFGLDLSDPYVLISISTPPRPKPHEIQGYMEDASSAALLPDEFRLDVLRLRFHDLDTWPIGLTDRERAHTALYSPEQAAQVAAFVRAWPHADIVVHCDAGISRSQGMAEAIAKHRGVRAKHSGPGDPNKLVFKLTWNALRPGEEMGAHLFDPKTPLSPFHETIKLPEQRRIRFTEDPYKDPHRLT
jgi:hypothetical protein